MRSLRAAVMLLPLACHAMPSDTDIRQILRDRIDVQRQSVGIVVGVLDAQGRRVIAYGSSGPQGARDLDADSLYEIGSVTKVFTSLLLSDMVVRHEVSLTDPVQTYLPAGTRVPERGGRAITFVDIATHTSGLPRMPANFHPKDERNPYFDYPSELAVQFLSSYQLTRDIGASYEYSNFAVALMGQALAQRVGTDYETALRQRILDPLQMTSTAITLSPELQARLVHGHDAAMKEVPNWDLQWFAPAGALRSSTNDLLTFLGAMLGYRKTSLAPAMAGMLDVRRPASMPGLQVALAWNVRELHGRSLVWHSGATGGYSSFIGYDPTVRAAVVVLSNAQTGAGVDDIGLHLLDEATALHVPAGAHKEVAVEPRIYDHYVGRYQLKPNVEISVTRRGSRLFLQASNEKDRHEGHPESATRFFLKEDDMQVSFETDSSGDATSLTLHVPGQDFVAPRKR